MSWRYVQYFQSASVNKYKTCYTMSFLHFLATCSDPNDPLIPIYHHASHDLPFLTVPLCHRFVVVSLLICFYVCSTEGRSDAVSMFPATLCPFVPCSLVSLGFQSSFPLPFITATIYHSSPMILPPVFRITATKVAFVNSTENRADKFSQVTCKISLVSVEPKRRSYKPIGGA